MAAGCARLPLSKLRLLRIPSQGSAGPAPVHMQVLGRLQLSPAGEMAESQGCSARAFSQYSVTLQNCPKEKAVANNKRTDL